MVGNELKERREALGLSAERLAHRLDVSANSIARWENGVSKPNAKNAYLIKRFFLEQSEGE